MGAICIIIVSKHIRNYSQEPSEKNIGFYLNRGWTPKKVQGVLVLAAAATAAALVVLVILIVLGEEGRGGGGVRVVVVPGAGVGVRLREGKE